MIRLIATPESRQPAELIEFFRRIRNPGARERRKVADVVRQGFSRSFTSRASGAGPWRQLADSTVLDRLRQGYGGRQPILVRCGGYRTAFLNASDGQHLEEHETTGDGWALTVGSRDRRVPWLEGGTRTIPAREVTVLGRAERGKIGDVLDWLIDQAAPR